MAKHVTWRNFWILWLGGLLIITYLLSQSDQLVTDVAPRGMMDHQGAGDADTVDRIHASWESIWAFVQGAILLDLLFIAMYSVGGMMGGILVRREAHSRILKAVGTAAFLAYALFGLFDFTETICQALQVFVTGGNDVQAGIAALAQMPKFAAFFAGLPILLIALIWLWVEKRSA